ncbi:conjugal transfer protein TraB [Pinisolibacter sp.]|uniref:conjugal transfer protein TraB n=1 Tax=Pinisolibacter sp. TaxID=2172024 RepID=UPI002FDD037B
MLVVAAGTAGMVGWNGDPRTLPVALVFPALWGLSRSRWTAAAVATAYFLAASRGLPQGVVTFFGTSVLLGVALWIGAALAFVGVHAGLWSSRPGWGRVVRYAVAAVLMAVPPFGIVGWAHPITAAGILFPAWGWWGLGATATLMLTATTRARPAALALVAGLTLWSSMTWTDPPGFQGWIGLDLRFGRALGRDFGMDQHEALITAVRGAAAAGARVVVLPENALGLWTPTIGAFWRDRLRDLDVEVVAGATVVHRDGYDNVVVAIDHDGAWIVHRQRMPVPVSMWRPWLSWLGEPGGARAEFFGASAFGIGGRRVAPLVCYEQLLVWPILQSMAQKPDLIVAIGNGWWTAGTNIAAIQTASSTAWARLFGLPLVASFNR